MANIITVNYNIMNSYNPTKDKDKQSKKVIKPVTTIKKDTHSLGAANRPPSAVNRKVLL